MTPQDIVEFFKRLTGGKAGEATISIQYDEFGAPLFSLSGFPAHSESSFSIRLMTEQEFVSLPIIQQTSELTYEVKIEHDSKGVISKATRKKRTET